MYTLRSAIHRSAPAADAFGTSVRGTQTHKSEGTVSMRRTKIIAAAAVSLCLLAAACSSATKKASSSSAANNPSGSVSKQPGSTEKASHKQGGTVTIVNVQGQ